LCLVLLTSGIGGALAQGTASRVTGTVVDQSGAIIPDATVTLTNEATKVDFTTQTTSTGNYSFDSVQVGIYTVTVEKQGFKKFVSTTNQINVNQPATIDVALDTGGLNEVVTVEASAELVQTSSSGNFGNTVEEKTLTTLPIVGSRGRNPLSFILFQPGVAPDANTGGGVHVHGARDRAFNFTLDGIDINDTTAGGSNFTPVRANPDSLSQFQVVTGNFTAELGRSSGAQVSLITKSGTNEFHGNLFEFYQTPRFHANEYQNGINTVLVGGQRVPTIKPQFVQHIFGGSIGGPVYLPRFGEGGDRIYNGKNRTFFFVNLQNLRTSQTILRNRTVYTAAARAGQFRYIANGQNGNLLSTTTSGPSIDASGNPVYAPCPSVVTTSTPRCLATFNVANNPNIPLSFDPTTTSLIGLTPLPNNFRLGDGLNTAGFTFVAPQTERQYDFTTKIDHNFNDRNAIYVRYSRGSQNTLGDNVNGGLQAFPGLPNIVDTFRSPRNLAVNYRATITPNLVNEFVAGFNRFTFSFNNPDPNAAQNSPVVLSGLTDPLNASPTVTNARKITTRQFVDNLSWARSAHTFKFGTNIRLQQHVDDRSSVAGTNTRETVTLSTANNAVPASFGTRTATTGINITSDRVLLETYVNNIFGRIGAISQGFVATDDGSAFAPAGNRFLYDARYPELDFYGQDTWKLRPNLTIDYGLRWEVRLSPRAPNDIILRPSTPVRVGAAQTNTLTFEEGKLYDDQYKQFAPSVGIAYDPFGTGKTSIRANYRLAYDRTNTFVFSSFIFQSAPGLTRGITVRATDSIFGGQNNALLRNGLPVLSANDRTPQQFRQPPAFSVNTLTVVDPDLSYPRTHQYGVSFQREVGKGNVLEVNYIGRQGRKLFGGYDANQMDITGNGFLAAFRQLQDPASRASVITDPNFLINRLLAGDTRLETVTVGGVARPETGAELLLRQGLGTGTTPVRLASGAFAGNIVDAGGVANATAFINLGRRSSNTAVPVFQANGFSPFLFQPFPQFSGAVNVLDNNDESHYNALEIQISRRARGGLGYQASYTLAKSTDTRSFDPTFAIANRGNAQSSANTPFDIRDRKRNLARSDFDRRHSLQGYFTYELPFGRGRRFLADSNGFVDRLVGGFELAGIVRLYSGRPFTIYSGLNTFSNVLQSPVSCNGCTSDMGTVLLNANGRNAFFTPEQAAQFFVPAAGELGTTGRNFFNGPRLFQLDVTVGKRIKFTESLNLELRMEAQNATNTPSFDFPIAVLSSTSFGVINDAVISSSRKVQFAAKFNF